MSGAIDLPEPLTAPECDCRGLPFMPLDVVRLRESDLAALATGDEFKAAVLLWCAAWNQSPAASLPDDERVLARLAGYSLGEWRTLSEMALRGWVKCTDGRLYHPVVAEKANEAFRGRLNQRARAAKRWAKPLDAAAAEPRDSRGINEPMPRHSHGTLKPMQGTGTGTGTVRGSVSNETETGLALATPPARQVNEVGEAFGLWNSLARELGLPVAKDLTAPRKMAIRARLREHGLDGWRDALAGVAASRFCRGLTDRPFKADLDFVCQAKSFQRLRERFYGEDAGSAGGLTSVAGWDDARWSIAMQHWRDERSWSVEMGPEPGAPGCLVPAHLVVEPVALSTHARAVW